MNLAKRNTKIILILLVTIGSIFLFFTLKENNFKVSQTKLLPSDSIRFTDITTEAGITHKHKMPAATPECEKRNGYEAPDNCNEMDMLAMLGPMTGGVAVGDYNNDGFQDLFFTQTDNLGILYENNDKGVFVDVTKKTGLDKVLQAGKISGNGATWVDIDNDKDLDLYVTAINSKRFYLFVNENGTFTEEAIDRNAAIASDQYHAGYSIAMGDFNRDGWVDLHTTEWNTQIKSSHSRLLQNGGAKAPGKFTDVTETAGLKNSRYPFRYPLDVLEKEVAKNPRTNYSPGQMSFASSFTDMDNDGWQDLIIAGDFGSSQIFWNNKGKFSDGTKKSGVARETNSMGSTIGDIDNDGDMDWFVSAIYMPTINNQGRDGNSLYYNDGGRKFTDVSVDANVRKSSDEETWAWGSAMFDYDNDGDLDLVMTTGDLGPTKVIENPTANDEKKTIVWQNEGGKFVDTTNLLRIKGMTHGRGLAVLDYDNDGDLDLVIVNVNEKPTLYRNDDGSQAGPWLKIKVNGGQGTNTQGLGAIVKIQVGDNIQTREIGSTSHFLGQSESLAHFGFEAQTEIIDNITITWPASGKQQIMNNVAIRQTLEINEPL